MPSEVYRPRKAIQAPYKAQVLLRPLVGDSLGEHAFSWLVQWRQEAVQPILFWPKGGAARDSNGWVRESAASRRLACCGCLLQVAHSPKTCSLAWATASWAPSQGPLGTECSSIWFFGTASFYGKCGPVLLLLKLPAGVRTNVTQTV